MKKINEYLFVVISIFFVLFILFNKFIFGDFVFLSGDSLAPQAVKQALSNLNNQSGLFPYWFPYIFSGMPTVHSLLNTNIYYFPHIIINYLYNLGMPWFWNFIFHYIFAGVGMYAFIRYLKQSKYIAILSAILFSISPYMIAYLVHGHGSQMMTASYIPWILLFLFKLYKQPGFINFSLFSFLIGFQLQRGHVQIVYYTWLMIGFYILFNIIFYYLDNKSDFSKVKLFLSKNFMILLSLICGFLTAFKIYYPILNYSQYSTRGSNSGGFGIENATQWSLHIKESLTFILPYSYGFGGQDYWGFLPMTDFPNYIGILVIFLAIIGLFSSDIDRKNKFFFLALIVFSFLLSLGKNFMPFYKFFYSYLPYFNKFRAPIFFIIIMQFCIYVLAAFGLNKFPELLKDKIYKKRIIYSLGIIICLITINSFSKPEFYQANRYGIENHQKELLFSNIKNQYLYIIDDYDLNGDGIFDISDKTIFEEWTDSEIKLLNSQLIFQNTNKTNQELVSILRTVNESINNKIKSFKIDHIYIAFALLFLLLVIIVNGKYIEIKKYYYIYIIIILLIIDYIRVDLEIIYPNNHTPNRDIVKESIDLDKYLQPDETIHYLLEDRESFRLLDMTNASNPNRLAAFNLQTINGYHPAKLSSYNKMLSAISNKGGAYPYGLIQALNIKYILHSQRGSIPNFNLIDESFKYLSTNIQNQDYVDVYIYKNKNILERIFIVNNIELVNNDQIIIDKITSQSFDPVSLSYINKNYLNESQIDNLKHLENSSNSYVNLVSWETDQIIFETNFDKPQLVCLSEIDYPGWIIKDENIDIVNINGLFRGAILPKGKKQYIMKFEPSDINFGLLISRITYVILLCLLIYGFYRRKYV